MNIGNVTAISDIGYGTRIFKENNSSAAEFSIPNIEEQKSEISSVVNGTTVDAVSTMEAMTGKIAANEPSYSVTDEEAEYFREKYGENYDDDIVHELYYELAGKGIISTNDASRSSGVIAMIPLSAFKSITYFGSYLPGQEKINRNVNFADLTDDVVYIKDISRKDKNAYKHEWDRFKEKYDREILTWKDALQESLDFERYLKEIAKNSTSGKHYPAQWHFDSVIEKLEKTKDVISQIFD